MRIGKDILTTSSTDLALSQYLKLTNYHLIRPVWIYLVYVLRTVRSSVKVSTVPPLQWFNLSHYNQRFLNKLLIRNSVFWLFLTLSAAASERKINHLPYNLTKLHSHDFSWHPFSEFNFALRWVLTIFKAYLFIS